MVFQEGQDINMLVFYNIAKVLSNTVQMIIEPKTRNRNFFRQATYTVSRENIRRTPVALIITIFKPTAPFCISQR